MIADPASVEWDTAKEFIIREALSPLIELCRMKAAVEYDEGVARSCWLGWIAHWLATTETKALYVLLDQAQLTVDRELPITDQISVIPVGPELQQSLWRASHAAFEILPPETDAPPTESTWNVLAVGRAV